MAKRTCQAGPAESSYHAKLQDADIGYIGTPYKQSLTYRLVSYSLLP